MQWREYSEAEKFLRGEDDWAVDGKKLDTDIRDEFGDTALHFAASANDVEGA
jgi:ankyrin repeat protein